MNKQIVPPWSISHAVGLTIPSNPAITRLFHHVSQITRTYPSLFRTGAMIRTASLLMPSLAAAAAVARLFPRTEGLDSIISKPLIDRRCPHCRAPMPTESKGT